MLLNKNNLPVADAASTDDTRPALQSVHVTPEYTEATDGHIFARVSLQTVFEDDDFPEVAGFEATEPDPKEEILIPASDVKSLRQALPKGKTTRTLPILGHVRIDPHVKDNRISAAVTDLTSPQVRKIHAGDGPYPKDIDKIIFPDHPDKKLVKRFSFYFNPKLMIRLLKIADEVCDSECAGVTLEFYANKRGPQGHYAAMVRAKSRNTGQEKTEKKSNVSSVTETPNIMSGYRLSKLQYRGARFL